MLRNLRVASIPKGRKKRQSDLFVIADIVVFNDNSSIDRRRRRRQTQQNTCTSGCADSIRQILDDTINTSYVFNIFLQYRENCSTYPAYQQNTTARLISYDPQILTTYRKLLLGI